MITLLLALLGCPGPSDTGDTTDPNDTDTDDTNVSDCEADADGDGSKACDDCDDGDDRRFPGASESCDGVDNDCDGQMLDDEADTNGDGVSDCVPCAEAGFYELINEASDAELFDVLHDATEKAACTYDRSRREIFQVLDEHDGGVTCVYTGQFFEVDSYPPDNWQNVNTEHSWPQSQGADIDPMQCDIHHLYPTDADVNSRRSSYPFDDVVHVDQSFSGSALGDAANGETVFEPRDAHKGNAARTMLYFWVRYHDRLDNSAMNDFARGRLSTYQDWAALDPADEAEIARSFGIADYQGKANPFVVCPELVDRFVESDP